jgi:hypothetical protein
MICRSRLSGFRQPDRFSPRGTVRRDVDFNSAANERIAACCSLVVHRRSGERGEHAISSPARLPAGACSIRVRAAWSTAGLQVGGLGTLSRTLLGVHAHLTDDVLGFAVIARHGAGNPIETLIVALHDDAKRTAPSLRRANSTSCEFSTTFRFTVGLTVRLSIAIRLGWSCGLCRLRVPDADRFLKRGIYLNTIRLLGREPRPILPAGGVPAMSPCVMGFG